MQCFFFSSRRRHTRLQGDWSSDVCSSDLLIFFTGTERTPQLGLDLRGGTTVTLTARTPDGRPPAPEELELARQIIEQRVNGLGVAEAEVVTEGESNIVISVPVDSGEQAREICAT